MSASCGDEATAGATMMAGVVAAVTARGGGGGGSHQRRHEEERGRGRFHFRLRAGKEQ